MLIYKIDLLHKVYEVGLSTSINEQNEVNLLRQKIYARNELSYLLASDGLVEDREEVLTFYLKKDDIMVCSIRTFALSNTDFTDLINQILFDNLTILNCCEKGLYLDRLIYDKAISKESVKEIKFFLSHVFNFLYTNLNKRFYYGLSRSHLLRFYKMLGAEVYINELRLKKRNNHLYTLIKGNIEPITITIKHHQNGIN